MYQTPVVAVWAMILYSQQQRRKSMYCASKRNMKNDKKTKIKIKTLSC